MAAVAALTLYVAAAQGQDEVTVQVTGESAHSAEEAKEDALRKAVEQGAGKTVFSDTRVADFQLMHDTIVSRARGYVKRFDVLKQWEEDGVYYATVRAVVAVGEVDDDWGALQVLIERKGRPNLLIVVQEDAGDVGATGNVAEYRLRDVFEALAFDLVDDEAIAGTAERDAVRAELVGDERRAAAVAAQLHAGYAVTGRAKLRKEPASTPYAGVTVIPVTADLLVKIVAADSAELLASKSASARRTSRDAGTAAKLALEDAAAQVGKDAMLRMLAHWSRDIDVGARVMLEGVRIDTEVLNAFIERLRAVPGVKSARVVDHNRELTSVKVVTRLEPKSIADEIPSLSGGRFTTTGYSGARVAFAMRAEEQERKEIEKEARPGARIEPGPSARERERREQERRQRQTPRGTVAVPVSTLIAAGVAVIAVAALVAVLVSRRRR